MEPVNEVTGIPSLDLYSGVFDGPFYTVISGIFDPLENQVNPVWEGVKWSR